MVEEEKFAGDKEGAIPIKQLDNQIMKNYGVCKECKRKERTYKEKCFWCYIEKHNKLLSDICTIIRNEGRSNMVDKSLLENLRDEYLEE
jgi:hypothetical protein